jgi:hypothetical protein
MKKPIFTTFLCLSLLGVTGCTSTPKKEVKSTSVDYEKLALQEQKKLYLNIQTISYKALETQRIRQKVQNAASLQKMDADQIREANWQNNYIPVGMDREFTIDWKYDPEPLLKMLANYAKYTISFKGKPYPIKKNIIIHPEKRNIKDIIDDVAYQTKGYIDKIEILEDIKHINIIYMEH